MKFNVDGKIFQQRLQAASKVINGKNALSSTISCFPQWVATV